MSIAETTKVAQAARRPLPPKAERWSTVRQLHGFTLVDDYAWLKAANWQAVLRNPRALPGPIAQLIDAENHYADVVLERCDTLRQALLKDLRARIKEDDATVPSPDGPFAYYSRHRSGGEHEIICRKPRDGGIEEVLLDGDQLAQGKSFFHLVDAQHAPNHKLLAWSADEKGSELNRIHVRDVTTGQDLQDIIEDTEGIAVWTTDSTAFYYVRVDASHRPAQVFRHRVGTDPAQDALILGDPGPGWFTSVRQTQSGRFAVIAVRDHESSECHLVNLQDSSALPRLVAAREAGVRYDLEHHDERLIIRTNADAAQDFKIVEAPLRNPSRANWRDVIPHQRGRMIITGSVFKDFMIRLERENGLPRIVVREWATTHEHVIDFDEEAYSLGLEAGFEFDTDIVRFSYSSMTTPTEIWDYNMRSHRRSLRKRQEIPSGHDPGAYITRRVYAVASDGERVPISLLYARNTRLDGTAPLLLYAYGAYGHAVPAAFSANCLSLVDRGFVYAIAHVRGGTDKGWAWYLDGKLTNKPNTFTDFAACAQYLIAEQFTSPGRIVAQGGSAGGMVMGVIANRAPSLFGGIIAEVPFVDVLNTMLDDTLPLTPPEWREWGNPIADPRAFETICSYSPYDNIRAQHYPAMLVLAGLTDPRVTYWEPAKWVARLRATMSGGGPILLRTNMDAGHGGASGRFERLEEVALGYAFALKCVAGDLRP